MVNQAEQEAIWDTETARLAETFRKGEATQQDLIVIARRTARQATTQLPGLPWEQEAKVMDVIKRKMESLLGLPGAESLEEAMGS